MPNQPDEKLKALFKSLEEVESAHAQDTDLAVHRFSEALRSGVHSDEYQCEVLPGYVSGWRGPRWHSRLFRWEVIAGVLKKLYNSD
jgi:hypothetical protein